MKSDFIGYIIAFDPKLNISAMCMRVYLSVSVVHFVNKINCTTSQHVFVVCIYLCECDMIISFFFSLRRSYQNINITSSIRINEAHHHREKKQKTVKMNVKEYVGWDKWTKSAYSLCSAIQQCCCVDAVVLNERNVFLFRIFKEEDKK